jgi:hypothetical protein
MRIQEWLAARQPDEVRWVVMRITKCQLSFFRHDEIAWTRDLPHAWGFKDRAEAWAIKNTLGKAFLVMHDGGGI